MWLHATGATMYVWKKRVTQEAVFEYRVNKHGRVRNMLSERSRPYRNTCGLALWSGGAYLGRVNFLTAFQVDLAHAFVLKESCVVHALRSA